MDFSTDLEKLKAMETDGEGEHSEQPPAPSPADEYAKAILRRDERLFL